MQRYRKIAAAPARTSSQSWQVIATVIRDSLGRSEQISAAEVDTTLSKLDGVAPQLIAGGHLDDSDNALTLVAAELHVCFNTVSGDKALSLQENLNFVPGAANATEWTIHLPTPDPLGRVLEDLAGEDDHLSSEAPPEPSAAASEGALDKAALREWARGGA